MEHTIAARQLGDNPVWRNTQDDWQSFMARRTMEDLTAILAFVRTAEARSFTSAARQLGLSPSGVSKAISRIESRFQVRLLQRSSRSVTLTAEGAAFYERCRRILLDLEEAEQALSRAHAVARGLLRISLPLALGRRPLARLLPEFARRHPEIEIEARISDRLVDLIEEGFDVAVRLGQPQDSRFVARRLMSGELITCAAPAYLERHGTPKTPEDLRAHNCARFIVPSTGVARDWMFMRGAETFAMSVSGNLAFDHAEALVEAATAGTAIIQISSYVTGEAIAQGLLKPVLTRFVAPTAPVWVLYPQNRHLTPRVRAFVDFVVERAQAGWVA
jgi:DNA-binding transcriptional LysR family regulator